MKLKGVGKSIESALLDCLELLYAGVSEKEARRQFFKLLSRSVGSIGAGLETADPYTGALIRPVRDYEVYVTQPDVVEKYVQVAHMNPFKKVFREPPTPGMVGFGSDRVDLNSLRDTAYWRSFLGPLGLKYPARIVPAAANDLITIIHFAKEEANGDFDHAERQFLARVAPHLTNFFTLDSYVDTLTLQRDTAWASLDALPYGIVLLDRDGRIQFTNLRADAIFEERDGLVITSVGHSASAMEIPRPLQAAIRGLLAEGTAVRVEAPVVHREFVIERPSGRRAYRVLVSPLMASESQGGGSAAICILIHDPDAPLEKELGRLRSAYGLTQGEAEVALGLCCGMTLEECAVETRRAVSTARTLLKRALYKTGARQQSELVSLIMSDVLAMRSTR
ncbi:MAG: hypothetical protein V2J02_01505 [Pseudomonadales bacterium]|jgi:PAS domain-containing protein|nr:hypothetical protein [Pseudomonadales bacterium]